MRTCGPAAPRLHHLDRVRLEPGCTSRGQRCPVRFGIHDIQKRLELVYDQPEVGIIAITVSLCKYGILGRCIVRFVDLGERASCSLLLLLLLPWNFVPCWTVQCMEALEIYRRPILIPSGTKRNSILDSK